MEQLRAGKLTKSSIDRETPSLATSGATLRSQEALATAASSSGTERSEPSSLDESFSVRLSVNIDSDPESESSDDDGAVDFTSTSAQHIFHDWLQQQPKEYIRMMAVMAMDVFMARFGLTAVSSAKEAGLFLQVNEKTVRTWRKDFYANHGSFSESRKGKHSRPFVLDDEDCRRQACEWIRQNASLKGKPNMTAAMFTSWVNRELLPNSDLPPGCPQVISERTAAKWLNQLGFHPYSLKKGVYIDGHERDDVVQYRKLFLRKLEILEETHLPPLLCSDELTAFPVGCATASRSLVLIFHDESSFHANEGQSVLWAEEGRVPIRPKSQGRGLMVSDFVTEHHGLLQLNEEEYEEVHRSDASIPQCAREIFKFGVANDGYWNSERFLKQMEKAITIANVKYPPSLFNKVWLFDQSSGHCAFKEDSLNVRRMNVNPGGAQPRLRDTVWDGQPQRMVLPDGRQKGMKLVLQERGIDTERMKAADMRLVLGNHDDFKYEKTALEYLIRERGQRMLFVPKFHCELNPIERVWGEAKRYTRSHCDYSFAGLERTIVPALESVRLDTIRKYFRKCREYMQAYRQGSAGGKDVEQAVKLYKSHRRVFGRVE